MRTRIPNRWFAGPRDLAVSTAGVFIVLQAGCVASRCYENRDCPSGKVCGPSGACVYQCTADQDCTTGFACIDHQCKPRLDADSTGAPLVCPEDMVLVANRFCVDRHEASRPDATATSAGSDESRAVSVAGVLPWYVNPMTSPALASFEAACEAAGKRLCAPDEWLYLCQGPEQATYFFGNTWDPAVCNSVDTFCQECCDVLGDVASCPTGENCGYSSTLTSSYAPETCGVTQPYSRDSCHVCYHVMPTGSFPGCRNEAGIYDVNGNVWEVVPVATSVDNRGYQVRGGAFNCASPSARFQCDFNAGWSDLFAGFRCCKDAER